MKDKEFGFTNDADGVVSVPVETKEPTLNVPVVEKKKRGRPAKKVEDKVELPEEYYCSTCRERFAKKAAMTIGAGHGRYAIFCPFCNKSVGFNDAAANEIIKELHKNPRKKND